MAKKVGLGRGLGALIPDENENEIRPLNGALEIAIQNILPNPHQPRQKISSEELEDLAASIREHGVLQPLIVRNSQEADHYILIAGERRLRASELAGMETVPVLIREVTEQQELELALIENVQRSDLTPLETARAYQELHDQFKLTHEEIAVRVGKSRESVSNTLRLLKLPDPLREALLNGEISEGHARALLGLVSPLAQVNALKTVLAKRFTVRETEEYIQMLKGEKPERQPKPAASPEIKSLEERLRNHFGTKVNLNHGKKGGSMTIHYYSDEELETILSQIFGE